MKWILTILIYCLTLTYPVKAQTVSSPFDKQVAKGIKELNCPMPDERDPVTINAVLIKETATGKMAVVIKALIAPGWHLYSFVPSDKPYITTECLMKLPPGITAVGGWEKTRPLVSGTDRGVLIWEREVIFVQRLKSEKKDTKGIIQTGLSYQTCDLRQCLPPTEKSFDLEF
jgi:hypothetical protein